MKTRLLLLLSLVLIAGTLTMACNSQKADMKNDLTLNPAAGGVRDPSIKPIGPIVPAGGLRDPSIKPIAPVAPAGGLRDPSVKPLAPIAPTDTAARTGIPDDSIRTK